MTFDAPSNPFANQVRFRPSTINFSPSKENKRLLIDIDALVSKILRHPTLKSNSIVTPGGKRTYATNTLQFFCVLEREIRFITQSKKSELIFVDSKLSATSWIDSPEEAYFRKATCAYLRGVKNESFKFYEITSPIELRDLVRRNKTPLFLGSFSSISCSALAVYLNSLDVSVFLYDLADRDPLYLIGDNLWSSKLAPDFYDALDKLLAYASSAQVQCVEKEESVGKKKVTESEFKEVLDFVLTEGNEEIFPRVHFLHSREVFNIIADPCISLPLLYASAIADLDPIELRLERSNSYSCTADSVSEHTKKLDIVFSTLSACMPLATGEQSTSDVRTMMDPFDFTTFIQHNGDSAGSILEDLRKKSGIHKPVQPRQQPKSKTKQQKTTTTTTATKRQQKEEKKTEDDDLDQLVASIKAVGKQENNHKKRNKGGKGKKAKKQGQGQANTRSPIPAGQQGRAANPNTKRNAPLPSSSSSSSDSDSYDAGKKKERIPRDRPQNAKKVPIFSDRVYKNIDLLSPEESNQEFSEFPQISKVFTNTRFQKKKTSFSEKQLDSDELC